MAIKKSLPGTEMVLTVERNGRSDTSNLPDVLYVEDDQVAVDFVSTVLGNYCRVDIANNSGTAIEKAKKHTYAAILMDINLGKDVVDGVQTTRMIRMMTQHKDTPIIAVTAFAMEGDREEFLGAGCSHYLSKPFKIAELNAVLKDALEHK